jgi:hypothetical protein
MFLVACFPQLPFASFAIISWYSCMVAAVAVKQIKAAWSCLALPTTTQRRSFSFSHACFKIA